MYLLDHCVIAYPSASIKFGCAYPPCGILSMGLHISQLSSGGSLYYHQPIVLLFFFFQKVTPVYDFIGGYLEFDLKVILVQHLTDIYSLPDTFFGGTIRILFNTFKRRLKKHLLLSPYYGC